MCSDPMFALSQADYELNPYRRRGGEERVPTPQASVVGTPAVLLMTAACQLYWLQFRSESGSDYAVTNSAHVCRTIG